MPRLETARLLLREWRPEDHDNHAAMCADPDVMRFLGGPVDSNESWRAMALHAGHWMLRGYGTWVLERSSDASFLGRAGLWNPAGWPGVEVGWTLARAAWGHGYATEAARAAIVWARTTLGVERLISVIHPGNTRSIAVAKRLGMSAVESRQLRGTPVVVFALERDQLTAPTHRSSW